MNSFKKIALGMVAAIAMGTLVATPASATVDTALTVGGNAAVGGRVVSAPVLLPVPADNSVDLADALRIAITDLDTGTVVSAVATNGKIVTAVTGATVVTAFAGSSSASVNTGTGTTANFYVFTTSTAVGSVAVTIGGNVTTYFFQGTAGALSAIDLAGASSGAAGTTYTATVRGTDVFGNAKGNASINLQVVTNTASTTYALTTDTAVATLGSKTQDIVLPSSGVVRLIATASVASAVSGLATPVAVRVLDVTVRDLAAELAAEKAARAADKVAADKALADAKVASDKALADALAAAKAVSDKAIADLQAAHKLEIELLIAKHVATINSMKTAFNSLAKKWNAKNPRSKVTLIK